MLSFSREKNPASEEVGYSKRAHLNFVPEALAQIFCARIRETRHDDRALVRTECGGHLKTSFESGGGARAQQQSLFARGPFNQAIGFFRPHCQIGIGERRV